MMTKKHAFISLILILFQQFTHAQIAIGKTSVEGDALIDFPENTFNGIVIPHVESIDVMKYNQPGTIIFEKNTTKFKYFDGTGWITINRQEGKNIAETSTEEYDINQGVVIGSDSSDAIGVLILESTDKALVLPKVANPAKNIPSPYPGMMCYDLISDNVYFFNGSVWEFWGQ